MATAATAAKTMTSPSPFATLLRRSKFATYDPKIGQVYTTSGGDSHRGNYGLKRPLALRTREPFITVASIDSLQQQTEWSNAEREAKWIRKVAEVTRTPETPYGSYISKRTGSTGKPLWKVDSDFALGTMDPDTALEVTSEIHGRRQASIPNIDAMTPKQFKHYLKTLRTLRPAFREFLKAEAAKNVPAADPAGKAIRKSQVQSSNPLEQSRYPTTIHRAFLSKNSTRRVNDPESQILEQEVHPNGALAYTHFSDLEHYFWKNALPGRAVGKWKALVVSFAGLNARLPLSQSEGIQPVDWKSLVERGADTGKGISKFRVSQTEVLLPPAVVGHKPRGIDDMDVRMYLSSHSRLDMARPNPHLPWTRDYVSQVSDAPITGTRPGMTNPPPPPKEKTTYELDKSPRSHEERAQRLLDSVCAMLEKQQKGPPSRGGGHS